MHETGVCRDIVETVEMSALRGHAKRVVEVRLKLGEVHDVVPEILAGAFEWMARGTVVEGAKLVIERVPFTVQCEACGTSSGLTPSMRQLGTVPSAHRGDIICTRAASFSSMPSRCKDMGPARRMNHRHGLPNCRQTALRARPKRRWRSRAVGPSVEKTLPVRLPRGGLFPTLAFRLPPISISCMRRYVYGDVPGVSHLLIRSWMLNWLVKRECREAAGMERANMTAKRLRYPVGIQTFSEVRTNGYVYVDKTSYIYDLAHWSGKTFFLSRPRRFGKSLLISTMQAYFEGRYELFEGLAVAELEGGEWESYPVIRVDLSTVKTTDCDQLVQLLEWAFSGLEDKWGRNPDAKTPGSRFMALVQAAHKQTGKQVVVLVDEYDAPLLNVTHDAEKLQAFREVMREFYAPLKACDEILRFVFLSGITKFSQLSIFSELNNLTNISMLPQFAGVCGITEEELLGQMGEGVQGLAQGLGITYDEAFAQLKANYDGYHFSKVSPDIYNPFSLLSALANTDVSATGSPAARRRFSLGSSRREVGTSRGLRAVLPAPWSLTRLPRG